MKRLVKRLQLDDLGAGRGLFPLFVLFGLNAVDEFDQAAFNILAPEIRDAFGLSNSGIVAVRISLIPLLPLFGLAVGYLADRRRRTRLAAGGAAMWALFSVLTGLAPALAFLVIARIGAGFGRQVNQPTHQSLLADYYPPEARAGVYSMWRLANPLGQFVAPLAAGGIAYFFGFRAPFVLLAIPTLVFVMLASRLKDPVRGVHERRARGADEEVALTEEEAPTWEESWRTLNGVKTLRRVWRSLPFLIGGALGIGILTPLYYEDVFGVSEAGRGVLAAVNEPFQILGLLLGIPITTRLIKTKPSRVLSLFAAAASVAAGGFLLIALAPSIAFAVVGSCVVAFSVSILAPGFSTVASLIVPPRARGFSFSVNDLWALPGLVFVLVAARIGDTYGLRWGLGAMIPVFLIGAYVIASAGGQVAADIRAAQQAAVAQAESKRARERGEAKLLVCRGVDVRYGQVQVLFGVDFDVADGEVVALLGTNGAGKSTLLKAIAGLVDPAGGAIVFDGRDSTHSSAQFSVGRGIVLMPGGKSVFPTLTVAENLRAAGWLARDAADELAQEIEGVLERFPRLRERLDQPAGNLSGGEQQMLGLGMAFLAKPRLLMIDELSLGLAPTIVEQLLATVRDIHASGTTIILVEQSVNVALTVATRAVFMEKGEVRFEGPTAELLDRPDVLRSVFLEGASQMLTKPTTNGKKQREAALSAGQPNVLEVEGVSKSFGGIDAVAEVSFAVQPGEILGVIGPNGAGKTTLFDLVSGFVPLDAGRISLCGEDVTAWRADERARGRLGRSFQDARLFPSMTVRDVIAVAHDRRLNVRDAISPFMGLPDHRVEEAVLRARVEALIELVGLQAFADKFVGELSTGSRRIVDIACALAHDPVVLLLDEPSSGIAQRETEALGPLLLSIREQTGMALVIIEHDMPLITEVSDRLLALDLGRVVTTGPSEDVLNHPTVVGSYLGTDRATIDRSGPASVAKSFASQEAAT